MKVTNFFFTRGSVAVQWEIVFKRGSDIKKEELTEALSKAVADETRDFLSGYPVKSGSISAKGKCYIKIHISDGISAILRFVCLIV